MEQTKNYIVTKIDDLLTTAEVLSKEVQTNAELTQQSQMAISEHAQSSPDSNYIDVRQNLVDATTSHFNMMLMHQNASQISNVLYEMLIMAKMMKIDLGFDEEKTGALEALLAEGSPYIYAIEKGVAVMVDTDSGKEMKAALNAKTQSEAELGNLFQTYK